MGKVIWSDGFLGEITPRDPVMARRLGTVGFLGSDYRILEILCRMAAGQLSFFQFYNPEHFRGFGIGVAITPRPLWARLNARA